ncbi:uncharacterized protein HfgLR_21330 (plasmid) [Haloferax gibbonsii]|uniref:Uncharacterized protein n=1 Tax=Haloferax gibbonsii TaxID=35746 RepID=A0A871BL58_HALGI|nr:uncharacterized protein HfgLR_21330 [Haloferax gibbonsii]
MLRRGSEVSIEPRLPVPTMPDASESEREPRYRTKDYAISSVIRSLAIGAAGPVRVSSY